MSDAIIQVENLGKCYRIRHQRRAPYRTLRDVVTNKVRSWFQPVASRSAMDTEEDFWALKDVSFEIKQGDVVGIIGRNGSGKSTLLKLLSRITSPTTGRITLRGRVASLLEVGTGFHPELTGRENIFLNGAILGMTRAEIRSKFDEIVAFAEVEKFLDTPVKRYSSGMYVRLAFAVAAHLEPEILIVDEVLAVGDVAFQKKCLGKMQDVATGGRTVLFVSHQMVTMQNLCQTAILLVQGRVAQVGPVAEVVRHYLTEAAQLSEVTLDHRTDRQGTGAVRFAGIAYKDSNDQPVRSLTCGAPATIELTLHTRATRPLRNVRVALGIDNDAAQRVLVLSSHLAGQDFAEVPSGIVRVHVRIPSLSLTPGSYGFTLYCSVNGEVADWVKNAGSFDVEQGDFYGSGQMPPAGQGFMLMNHHFDLLAPGAGAAAL